MRISDWSSDVCSSDLRAAEKWRPRASHPLNLRALDPARRFLDAFVQFGDLDVDRALHVRVRCRSHPWPSRHFHRAVFKELAPERLSRRPPINDATLLDRLKPRNADRSEERRVGKAGVR